MPGHPRVARALQRLSRLGDTLSGSNAPLQGPQHCSTPAAGAGGAASPHVCVLGAGVVGLASAVRVAEALPGAIVTLIAELFDAATTSDGAGGLWKPYTLVSARERTLPRRAGVAAARAPALWRRCAGTHTHTPPHARRLETLTRRPPETLRATPIRRWSTAGVQPPLTTTSNSTCRQRQGRRASCSCQPTRWVGGWLGAWVGGWVVLQQRGAGGCWAALSVEQPARRCRPPCLLLLGPHRPYHPSPSAVEPAHPRPRMGRGGAPLSPLDPARARRLWRRRHPHQRLVLHHDRHVSRAEGWAAGD